MEKIDLDTILYRHIYSKAGIRNMKEHIECEKQAMLEFGQKLLEVAAENAKIKEIEEYPFMPTLKGEYKPTINKIIDKQSILDIIKQVE